MDRGKTRAGSDVVIVHETEEFIFGYYSDETYGEIPVRWLKNGLYWREGGRQCSLDLVEYKGISLEGLATVT